MEDGAPFASAEAHQYARLIELRDRCFSGNAAAFGRRMDIADTYAVRMFWPLGVAGRKGLGMRMQTKIREKLNLPPGWFDMPMGSALPPPSAGSLATEPTPPDYLSPGHEEDILIRAFRLAGPEARQLWMDQARGILSRHDTPSRLAGNS